MPGHSCATKRKRYMHIPELRGILVRDDITIAAGERV